jgi:hypothetical protein
VVRDSASHSEQPSPGSTVGDRQVFKLHAPVVEAPLVVMLKHHAAGIGTLRRSRKIPTHLTRTTHMDNDSPPKSELRQEYRRRLQVPLIVLDEQNQRIDGRTADISASGLGCMLSTQLHPGTVLMLSFSLPTQLGGQVVHARARVMNSTLHSDGFRTGLLWTDIAEETRQKIRAFAKPAPFLRI